MPQQEAPRVVRGMCGIDLNIFRLHGEPAHVVVDGNAGALRQQRQDPSL